MIKLENENMLKAPLIEVKFGTCVQTSEQILSVYVGSVRDAIAAARGDYNALEALERLFQEARYCAKDLKEQAYTAQNLGAL